MIPVSESVKDMLEKESSFGLEFGTNLFIGREPPEPDALVCIFDTPGYAPDLTLQGQKALTIDCRPAVQIRARGFDYLVTAQLLDDIKLYLHGISNTDFGGIRYKLIKALGDPAFLYWDENNRAVFYLNIDFLREGR